MKQKGNKIKREAEQEKKSCNRFLDRRPWPVVGNFTVRKRIGHSLSACQKNLTVHFTSMATLEMTMDSDDSPTGPCITVISLLFFLFVFFFFYFSPTDVLLAVFASRNVGPPGHLAGR